MSFMFKNIKSLKSLKGKTVIVRADLNVPIFKGEILDTTRIDNFMPTLKYLKEKEAKIVIISHLGRPKGEWKSEFSLDPIAKYMKIKLEKTQIENLKLSLENGEAVLLENIRFYKGETKNDLTFSKKLANLGEVFINDGFSVSHRSHASTVGITSFLPSYAGFQILKETKELDKILQNPKHPIVGFFGGLKVSTKAPIILNLLGKLDTLILGGAMANTFLKAKGFEIGESFYEKSQIENAKKIIKLAGKKLILPTDIMTQNEACKSVEDLEKTDVIMDIGIETIEVAKKQIEKHKTIIWNGALGKDKVFPFQNGTEKIAEKIAEENIFSITGGGDLYAFLKARNLIEKFSFVSTAGGAFLKYISGEKLPALEILKK